MKQFFSIVFILFSMFLIVGAISFVRADAKATQTWICLKAQVTGGFSAVIDQTLSGYENLDMYIVSCTEGTCGTGNSSYDSEIGVNGTSGITLSPNKLNTGGDGIIHIGVSDSGWFHVGTAFFGVIIWPPDSVLSGPQQALKQAKANLRLSANDVSNCTSVYWDPFGRVFDSQSLEPLSNTSVTLLEEKNGVKVRTERVGLVNPQMTKTDGLFNFLVNPGTYYLDAKLNDYSFVDSPALNPNWSSVYSDIYKPNEPIVEREQRQEHRDIPLQLNSGGTKQPESCPSDISHTVLRPNDNTTIVEGKITHPRSFAILTQGGKELLAPVQSDKTGSYRILLKHKENGVLSSEVILLSFVKYDLSRQGRKFPECTSSIIITTPVPTLAPSPKAMNTFFELFGITVHAQSTLIVPYTQSSYSKSPTLILIEPIPSYIEGYAYDANGKIAPNADVDIKTKFMTRPYFQIQADDKGFFAIDMQDLPMFNYDIVINPKIGNSNTFSTSKFIKVNETYLAANNINLMTGGSLTVTTENNGQTNNLTQQKRNSLQESTDTKQEQSNNNPGKNTSSVQERTTPKNNTAALILSLLMLFLLIAGATGVFLYMKMKKNQNGTIQ